VCTYTKGYYRNHPSTTASVIAGMGGHITLGSASLNAVDAQAILNATPGQPGNVSWGTDNLLLNLAQQVLAGELNVARGSTATSAQLAAIASANAAMTVTKGSLGIIRISTSLSGTNESTLESTIEGFNSSNDCG
jgi:hypothetical protein